MKRSYQRPELGERRRYQEPVICVDDVRTMNVICGSLTGLESDSGNEGGELEP